MRKILVTLIKLYQKTLSPDHSFWGKKLIPYGYCPYEVSCSEYCKRVISKDGSIKGGWKCVKRLVSCR